MSNIDEKMVDISDVIEKIEYTELIEQVSYISNVFTLAILKSIPPENSVLEMVNALDEFLISCTPTNYWGLTIGPEALVYKFILNDKSKNKLIQSTSNIYDWIMPKKPEDLCFFCNEEPILLTVAHEKMAYIEKKTFNYFKKK